jgi:hypothetical protein
MRNFAYSAQAGSNRMIDIKQNAVGFFTATDRNITST